MARNKNNSVLDLVKPYLPFVYLAGGLYLAWKFLGPASEFIIEPIKQIGQVVKDKTQAVLNPNTSKATTADILRLKDHANDIAEAFGTKKTMLFDWHNITENEAAAWAVLQHYKVRNSAGKLKVAHWTAPALVPYYKEVTGGRSLKTDLQYLGSAYDSRIKELGL